MLNSMKNWFHSNSDDGNQASVDNKDEPVIIKADPHSNNATKTWEKMRVKQECTKEQAMDQNTPITEDKVRFVCISDTHEAIERIPLAFVPSGDILIHAGDITRVGQPQAVKKFNDYLAQLPHKHKVIIAGNHDLTFDKTMDPHLSKWRVNLEKVQAFLKENGVEEVKDLLTNTIYLEDAMVNLYGINIYGSPWQPTFFDWGFNLQRGEEILERWNLIPDKTDVLITHGPPVGHGDTTRDGTRAGCVELLNTIQKRVKPLYHIFGHIHEGYGVTSDGYTTFINASTCTANYKPTNPPIVFDIPIPEGHSKQEVLDLTVTQYGSKEMHRIIKDTDSDSDELEFRDETSKYSIDDDEDDDDDDDDNKDTEESIKS